VVLRRIKEERIIIHIITRQKAKWNVTSFVGTSFEQVIKRKTEGKTSVKERRGRKRKHLLDYLKKKRCCCKLKEEALDRTVWRNGFGIS